MPIKGSQAKAGNRDRHHWWLIYYKRQEILVCADAPAEVFRRNATP